MRLHILASFVLLISLIALTGCNSKEVVISKLPTVTSTPPAQSNNASVPNPIDSVRRIGAEELHKLWEKKDVLIVDTRDEASFKAGHIPGAISIPSNMMAAKVDELPRDKMIVTYCT